MQKVVSACCPACCVQFCLTCHQNMYCCCTDCNQHKASSSSALQSSSHSNPEGRHNLLDTACNLCQHCDTRQAASSHYSTHCFTFPVAGLRLFPCCGSAACSSISIPSPAIVQEARLAQCSGRQPSKLASVEQTQNDPSFRHVQIACMYSITVLFWGCTAQPCLKTHASMFTLPTQRQTQFTGLQKHKHSRPLTQASSARRQQHHSQF